MLSFFESILSVVVSIINKLGYLGIAGGMAIESACIPLPSEVVLPLGGNMVNDGVLTLLQANVAAAVGSMFGSILAYAVGYWGGRPLILKYGHYFFVSEKHFYTAEKTFNKHGSATVFFGRLMPIIRTFISLPAGIAKMNFFKFIVYSLLGMLPWNFMLIYLGYKFGQQYETVVRPIFKRFEYGFIAILAIVIAYAIYKLVSLNKNNKIGDKS